MIAQLVLGTLITKVEYFGTHAVIESRVLQSRSHASAGVPSELESFRLRGMCD